MLAAQAQALAAKVMAEGVLRRGCVEAELIQLSAELGTAYLVLGRLAATPRPSAAASQTAPRSEYHR